MKALIFGISGQDGFYLNNILQKHGVQVIGVARRNGNWLVGDVTDRQSVDHLIKENKPDFVFHLAANSTTRHDALFENHESISTGSLNILESCYRHSKHSKVFISGSAVQFENDGQPISETTPFAPLSPYAVSRIASVFGARYYRSLGLRVYVGYFFNHDSPLRTEKHINQKIIFAIKRIKDGSNEIIEIGDFNARKEFNFAGDVMEAIWILVNQDEYFEAVIGSGKAYSIKEWIEACFSLAGLNWQEYVKESKGFVPEYKILVCDPRLIRSLGWTPKTDFFKLAELMYY